METPTIPKRTETPRDPEPRADQSAAATPQPVDLAIDPMSGSPATVSADQPAAHGSPFAPYQRPPMPPHNNTPWIVGGMLAALLTIVLVAALLIPLVIGLVAGGGLGAPQSNVSSQTLQVQGTPTVVVTNAVGNVHISTGTASTVTVQITKHVRARDGTAAQQAFGSMGATIAQQGNTITITSNLSTAGMGGMMQGRSVDYWITLPAGSVVRADVSAGNIDVANTTGPLTLTSSAGNVTATNVTFGQGSVLRTSAGTVDASGSLAPGASLEIRVSAGNATLQLPASTATHLSADVSVGNLTITGFPVSVSSTGITGRHASGDTSNHPQGTVSITVSTGNVNVAAR